MALSQGVALKRQLYGGGGKERIKYVTKHMLANGTQHYSSDKTTILSSMAQKQPSLKVRDFSKLYMGTTSHLTQFSIIYATGIISKLVCSTYNF